MTQKEIGLDAKDFIAKEKSELLNHPLFTDPFVTSISTAECLDKAKAKRFALLYYPHILRTRLYQANALGITPDENIQFVLSEILHDEYGLGDLQRSHMQQYRKFMYSVGITSEELSTQEIIPELEMYISTMMRLTQSDNWLAAVAAVGVASEHPIPKYYGLLLQGLRTIPGVTDSDLELFIGHMELDVEHSRLIENSLLPYLDNSDNQQEFKRGIQINMDARRVLHNGLYREIFN